jgi:hypothetical protein
METGRRGILLACFGLALGAAKFAVLRPLLTLQTVDFAAEQRDERAWSDEGARLKSLLPADYVAEKTKGVSTDVSGRGWAETAAGLRSADANERSAGAWLARAPADERRWGLTGKSYFYRLNEAPVAEIAGKLARNGDRLYVRMPGDGAAGYLRAELHVFSDDDFRFGSGFSHAPQPPAAFLFPFRRFSAPILLLGLAAYFVLPRRKREKGAIFYPGWRLALSDFAAFLLIGPFFALPFFVVGGTVQAVTQGWMLCLVFWPLAFLGVWLLRITAGYAGYEIVLREDGLRVRNGRGEKGVPFASLDHFQPLELRPPRWLVWAGLLAAFSGKGAARAGAGGRGLLLAGFSNGGVGLGLKDGTSIYIWITDAMGTAALKNAGKLLKALEQAGVPRRDEVQEIRSVAPPTGRDKSGRILKEGSETAVWILAGLPVAAMLIFFLIVLFGGVF